MDVFVSADLRDAWPLWMQRLAQGQVAILPTDTIYGLTANAWDAGAVRRVGTLKRRHRPCTIIPHQEAWALQLVPARARGMLRSQLQGHSGETFLHRFQPSGDVCPPVAELVGSGLVGLRRPRHWITGLAADAGVPLITTSVNISGQPHLRGLPVPQRFARGVDFMVLEGPLTSSPSALNFCSTGKVRRVERSP